MTAVSKGEQELIFVYGHGGTGKTFLWKTVFSSLRYEGKIVLAVASSGIASLLLPAGSLDRTLKDLMNEPETLFGGKIVVLGGDFRQTLPVKKKATKMELIATSIVESHLCNDEAIPTGSETSETEMLYPMKYLNTMQFPGFPPHELQLKVGSPIILLRNGDAIQANMDIHNIEHFNPRLKLGAAYRISSLGQEFLTKTKIQRWFDPVLTDLHLAATPATHYYINPVIPEADQTRDAYNFKGIVTDGTADAQFTFFTPAGDKVAGHPCSELGHKYKEADPRDIPIEILNTKGRKHIFQIRFSSSTRKGPTDFIVDDVLDKPDKPTISQSTSSSGKKAPGTPPHDVQDTVAETFVTATATDKNQTSTSPTVTEKQLTAKRPRLPEVSSATKKKKGD
ncbi:DNA helicase [Tanacetum coccineum]|uniref:ATP-dependent DNA helicase n=1 Tax=Tanacetum coccineum TaxID=301880 RepID=A0ABQ5CWR4_9ASTR